MTAPLWVERVDHATGALAGHSEVGIDSAPNPLLAGDRAAAQYVAGILARIAITAGPLLNAERVESGHVCAECGIYTTAALSDGEPTGAHFITLTVQTAHAANWAARLGTWLEASSAELVPVRGQS